MPDPWEPDYQKFKAEFEKYEVGENTTLIGHSCGSAFLVRWLGETKRKVLKLVLVAPWKIPDKDDKFRKEFYAYSIDDTIRFRVGEIVIFTADDEEDEGKESLKIFHQALGGEVIELKERGHYTFDDMGTDEFPELLEKIVKFHKRKALIIPINSKEQIFIQDRRGHKEPDWGYFGGKIETEETPIQAVIREAKEEMQINLRADELKYLGAFITNWDGLGGIRYVFLYHTEQERFNVLEGRGGYWLSLADARERFSDKERFDEIANKINSKRYGNNP